MVLDPIQTAHLVVHVIDDWLKSYGAGGFKSGKTIGDNPPKGYAMTKQRYWKFCDDISDTLSKSTGRKLVLTKPWRDKHYSDTIDDFAGAVTFALVNAPLSAAGKRLRPSRRSDCALDAERRGIGLFIKLGGTSCCELRVSA